MLCNSSIVKNSFPLKPFLKISYFCQAYNRKDAYSDTNLIGLMNSKLQTILLLLCCQAALLYGQTTAPSLTYHIETGATVGSGNFAPLWLTANRNGLSSIHPNDAYLRADLSFDKNLKHYWNLKAGLSLATAANQTSAFIVQQAYTDISWRFLYLSIGSKERHPFGKNSRLSSGGMVEGNNTRPVPQVRAGIEEFTNLPFTNGWLKVKGHVAYGRFTDDRWQRDHVDMHTPYVEDVYYHSKSLLFRIGRKEKLPLELDFGMIMAAQFGGKRYVNDENGNRILKNSIPSGIKEFFNVFIPGKGGDDTPWGDQVNILGNHVGSWNVALNYYPGDWKFRGYYEHYFDDHSQMFFEYGRWKDGHIGMEITFPQNNWISAFVWEGLATKDQSGPLLYDGFAGHFNEYQISASDNYYNNYYYQSWQHWGMGMGNPLLPAPLYNKDKSMAYKSNRIRSHHIGIMGNPAKEFSYRMLLSYTKHWGTYAMPLDEVANQFSSLYEATYSPEKLAGWSISVALGIDQGDYVGDTIGGMLVIKKEGILLK